ncbi:MAG: MucR family transcriptional regulator [Parvibaculaceae bacterium]|nr:MucR family transcriptional regulator [Parvibaculaceae bacterium]
MVENSEDESISKAEILQLASEIVSAYVSNNAISSAELPSMIQDVHQTLTDLGSDANSNVNNQEPAIAVKKSITPDYLICLEDGKKLKMLKRYLRSRYEMTPEEYRAKWSLPADYPMVAPNYAEQRSKLAKKIGLGQAAPQKRGRRRTS